MAVREEPAAKGATSNEYEIDNREHACGTSANGARWPFVHGLGAHLSVVVWSRRLWIEYLPQDLAVLNPYLDIADPYLDIAGGRPHVNRPVPQPPYIQYIY